MVTAFTWTLPTTKPNAVMRSPIFEKWEGHDSGVSLSTPMSALIFGTPETRLLALIPRILGHLITYIS